MKEALVTGADGFIASSLIPKLLERGWRVRATVMDQAGLGRLPQGVPGSVTGDLASFAGWGRLLEGVDAVVHLAARVHAARAGPGEWEAFRRDNVEATRLLAEACVRAGTDRLLFASSVKALGEETRPGEAWDESAPYGPQDSYGRSKAEAEEVLRQTASCSRLGPVVLRLPLVYGPGMRANMSRLFKAVHAGWPLPLGGIGNSRSLLYLGNLVDAVALCAEHPGAPRETFHIADAEALSTPGLAGKIGCSLGRPARLFPLPAALLAAAAAMTGRASDLHRLTGSLLLDSRKIGARLGWKPPFSVDQGLQATAAWFLDQKP